MADASTIDLLQPLSPQERLEPLPPLPPLTPLQPPAFPAPAAPFTSLPSSARPFAPPPTPRIADHVADDVRQAMSAIAAAATSPTGSAGVSLAAVHTTDGHGPAVTAAASIRRRPLRRLFDSIRGR